MPISTRRRSRRGNAFEECFTRGVAPWRQFVQVSAWSGTLIILASSSISSFSSFLFIHPFLSSPFLLCSSRLTFVAVTTAGNHGVCTTARSASGRPGGSWARRCFAGLFSSLPLPRVNSWGSGGQSRFLLLFSFSPLMMRSTATVKEYDRSARWFCHQR